MPSRYPIPAGEASVETEVKQSRFLATGTYAPTVQEAQAWIASIRKLYPDASHNCPAFRVGYGGQVDEWASDDGEPRGTAGRPMLTVLQGADLGDVVVVVTRYFGGTKLGTGGLVRAYGGAVQALLQELPVKMLVARCQRMLAVPYSQYERIKTFVLDYEAENLQEEFAADVTLSFSMPIDRIDEFDRALTELSMGALEAITFEIGELS